MNFLSIDECGYLGVSQLTNPRTPFNSTAGISRRTSPPLPPIQRSLTASKTPPVDESKRKAKQFVFDDCIF